MKFTILIFFATLVVCLIINENCCSGAYITSENENNGNSEKIPVTARKAGGGGGGGGRKNRVDTTSTMPEGEHIFPLPDETPSESKDVIPVRARKAGGGRGKTPKSQPKPKEEDEDKTSPEYSNESQEEGACKSDEFWHIRGKRCVPLKCHYGRDVETGQCFDRHGAITNGSGRRYVGGGSGYRYKSNHKTFGLGRFGIRAGGKKGR